MLADQATNTLKAVTSWARYGEYFAYDEQADLFAGDLCQRVPRDPPVIGSRTRQQRFGRVGHFSRRRGLANTFRVACFKPAAALIVGREIFSPQEL